MSQAASAVWRYPVDRNLSRDIRKPPKYNHQAALRSLRRGLFRICDGLPEPVDCGNGRRLEGVAGDVMPCQGGVARIIGLVRISPVDGEGIVRTATFNLGMGGAGA